MRLMMIGSVLLALAACSTDRRLLAPDPQAKEILSPESKKTGKQPMVYDPVCGSAMGRESAPWHTMYHGAEFYFDREECKRQFEDNPAAYSFVY